MAAIGGSFRTSCSGRLTPPLRPRYPSARQEPNSIEYDAVTDPYCSRRSDHGVDPSARELAEIADLRPVVANECPKNIRILG